MGKEPPAGDSRDSEHTGPNITFDWCEGSGSNHYHHHYHHYHHHRHHHHHHFRRRPHPCPCRQPPLAPLYRYSCSAEANSKAEKALLRYLLAPSSQGDCPFPAPAHPHPHRYKSG